MDGQSFDDLIKRLSRTQLTRLGVLRVLAASATMAVLGGPLFAGDLGAKKREGHGWRHNRRKRHKRTVCHCKTSDPTTCATIKVRPQSGRKHKKHCDYAGPCEPGKSGCAQGTCPDCPTPPAAQCTQNADCPEDSPYCLNGRCGSTPGGQHCNRNVECATGACTCGPNAERGVCQANYVFGFEPSEAKTWKGVTIVPSGTNGIPAHTGGSYGQAGLDGAAYSYMGGYSDVFPANGYTTQLAIYLDPAATAGNWFDYTSAISRADNCEHRRDFVFTVGRKTAGSFCVRASNNAQEINDPCDSNFNPYVFTAADGAGWYTFRRVFRNQGGVLAVDMSLLGPSDNVLKTWTRSDPSDAIGTAVGGNRYDWFPFQHWPNLPIDDSSRTVV